MIYISYSDIFQLRNHTLHSGILGLRLQTSALLSFPWQMPSSIEGTREAASWKRKRTLLLACFAEGSVSLWSLWVAPKQSFVPVMAAASPSQLGHGHEAPPLSSGTPAAEQRRPVLQRLSFRPTGPLLLCSFVPSAVGMAAASSSCHLSYTLEFFLLLF